MNLDLGSPAIEIAIGLAFVFFLLSVVVSALSEFWAGIFNLRAKTLKQGIEALVVDGDVVGKLLKHPLLRTDLTKTALPEELHWWQRLRQLLPRRLRQFERSPSYVSAENFARALIAELGPKPDLPTTPAASGAEPTPTEQLWKQLDAIGFHAETTQIQAESKKLEKWFDDGMERVSGWYKRKSQIITIVFAVIVAFGLNASTLRIAEALETDPGLREVVVKKAEEVAKEPEAVVEGKETAKEAEEQEEKEAAMTPKEKTEASEAGAVEAGANEIKLAGKTTSKALGDLKELKLPIFWGKQNIPAGNFPAIATWLAGILITIIAISLGAPFWFDTLGKLSNLRMAGKKPEESAAKPA